MIKKFGQYVNDKAQNENLKKFSKSTKKVDDVDSNVNLDYETQLNKELLAQQKPTKKVSTETNIDSSKTQVPTIDPTVQSNDSSIEHDGKYKPSKGPVNLEDDIKESNVDMYGKVAKFPKNTKVSSAINFLENVKLSKNRIWYIMVEKQDDELQMVKYDMKKGVNLSTFINELKKHYISKYKDNKLVTAQLEKIQLGGDREGNFSAIKNIPPITIDGKKIITRITEDLIKLLSGKAK